MISYVIRKELSLRKRKKSSPKIDLGVEVREKLDKEMGSRDWDELAKTVEDISDRTKESVIRTLYRWLPRKPKEENKKFVVDISLFRDIVLGLASQQPCISLEDFPLKERAKKKLRGYKRDYEKILSKFYINWIPDPQVQGLPEKPIVCGGRLEMWAEKDEIKCFFILQPLHGVHEEVTYYRGEVQIDSNILFIKAQKVHSKECIFFILEDPTGCPEDGCRKGLSLSISLKKHIRAKVIIIHSRQFEEKEAEEKLKKEIKESCIHYEDYGNMGFKLVTI